MKKNCTIPLYKSAYLYELSRINNSIYGYDLQQQNFIQVDIKHSIVYTYQLQSTSLHEMLNCRYVQSYFTGQEQIKSAYFCAFNKKIQRYSFFQNKQNSGLLKNYQNQENIEKKKKSTILTSNSMASFTGLFDAYQNSFIFTKFHQNHGMFSINWQQGHQKQKKLLKLIDYNPKNLILNRFHPQIIITDPQNHVKYFDIQKPNYQTLLIKKSIILFDTQYLYSTSTNLVSKFNDTYEVQAIDLKTGKQSFSFKGDKLPKKIETYGNNIFYLTQKGFFVYDKRKFEAIDEILIEGKQNNPKLENQPQSSLNKMRNNIKMNDFITEPNLGKIYLSITNEFKVLDFNFSTS